VKGSHGLLGRRRIGPLGIAVGLAVLPVLVASATVAVKHMRAPRAIAAVPSPPSPSAAPIPTPRPTPHPPLASTIAPGVDVVYWARWDGSNPSTYRLHAVDTAGGDRGYIDVPPNSDIMHGSDLQPQPSPDGRMLLIDNDVYASDGQWLARLHATGGVTVWSDDSRHLCHVSEGAAGGVAVGIDLIALDGTVVGAASYPLTHDEWGNNGAHVASCSAARGRASIVIGSGRAAASHLVQMNLLTGKVESDRNVCTAGDCPQPLVMSPDGRYLAATDSSSHTVVEDLTTGSTRRLALASFPLAFSGDGSRLLVHVADPPRTSVDAKVGGLRVIDWRSGAVKWSRPNADTLSSWAFSPPGAAIAVAACEHGGSTGVFPSGPCRLDLVDLSVLDGTTYGATAGDGLSAAFGWNLN
jgi:hypothetical protein